MADIQQRPSDFTLPVGDGRAAGVSSRRFAIELRWSEVQLPTAERRDSSSRKALLCRVCGEFDEMQGLRLTLPQARRLFGLREDVCVRVLDELIAHGELVRMPNGHYRRCDVI